MGFFGSLEAIRVKIAEILQIVIINNSFIYINLWSVVHLTSGFLVAWILYHFFKKKDLRQADHRMATAGPFWS